MYATIGSAAATHDVCLKYAAIHETGDGGGGVAPG